MASVPCVTLGSSGLSMPVIGLGTQGFPPSDLDTGKDAILEAMKAGYRHFDTAFLYGSEQFLGQAIIEALHFGIIKSRAELFITSKLSPRHAGRDLVVPAIKSSLMKLHIDYLDLYLIHMPVGITTQMSATLVPPYPKEYFFPMDIKLVWEGMEECKNLGLTKSIGVSNFSPKRLQELLSFAKIPPAVNQMEINPLWRQKALREFCKEKGIHITAYSPLGANGTMWGDNRILGCSVIEEIAQAKGKSTAQIALRWVHEQGVSLVAKSFNKERMKENLEIFDWSLTEEDTNKINELPQRKGVVFAKIFGSHDLILELDTNI